MAKPLRSLLALLILVAVLGLGIGGTAAYFALRKQPAPWANSCTAQVGSLSYRIDPAQARNAAIIAGVAERRGLAPRAVTIALATAIQESGLRNLDHGDRDSLGLFQQRPSQGWGSAAEIQDPYYAANAFYAALEKEKGWQTADVGDIAQEVQRSGFPDAYDKHVENARALASALTGEAPGAFVCTVRDAGAADLDGLVEFLSKTVSDQAKVKREGTTVTVEAANPTQAWAAASTAVAASKAFGVSAVDVGDKRWHNSWPVASSWSSQRIAHPDDRRVVVTVG